MTLIDAESGPTYTVTHLEGDMRLLTRITAIGLTPGCRLQVLQNKRKRPILISTRNSAIALNRSDCAGIVVEVIA